MKSGQLFWGLFLLTIGALFLGVKYDFINYDFSIVWDLWPLIFILWGAAVMFKDTLVRPVISALFGIFIAVMLFGIISNLFFNFNNTWQDNGDYSEYYNIEYNDSIKYAEFDFSSGAGNFKIEALTDKLIEAKSDGLFADYDFYSNNNDSSSYIRFAMNKKDFSFGEKFKNNVKVALNENPIWDFEFSYGAAKAHFDLSEYKVRNIRLNSGASNCTLKLGDKYERTNVKIEMGAAKLRIYVPYNSGCRIKSDLVLSSKSLKDFNKQDSGNYITSNYDSSENKIDIEVDAGVSSFKVIRY